MKRVQIAIIAEFLISIFPKVGIGLLQIWKYVNLNIVEILNSKIMYVPRQK